MRIRTFTARGTSAALLAARKALGADAVLLESKRLADGRVRVTAAVTRGTLDSGRLPAGAGSPGRSPSDGVSAHEDAATTAKVRDAVRRDERRSLTEYVSRLIPVPPEREGRRMVALVGPAGVGKTTTWAKLAAHDLYLRDRRVALATTDTVRIGGLEQAEKYARSIGAPLLPVRHAEDARATYYKTLGFDTVYVDTPGLSPGQEEEMQTLRRLLLELEITEVHLLLAAPVSREALARTEKRFAPLCADRLAFTRLDEAASGRPMLEAAVASRLPVPYVSTGPGVPDDLETVTPESLVAHGMNLENPSPQGTEGGVKLT